MGQSKTPHGHGGTVPDETAWIADRETGKMGWFSKITGLFGGNGSGKSGVKSFLVDAARLQDEKTGRKLSPREQLQVLGALSKIQKLEGFKMAVVFESDRPLREAEEGGEYQGVTVHYAETSEELVEKSLKLAKKQGYTVVTSGPLLESRVTEAKLPILSSATFRKAFLQGFSFRGGEDRGRRDRRGGGGNGGGERRRGERRRHGGGERRGGRGGAAAAPAESGGDGGTAAAAGEGSGAAPAASGGDGDVRNLIDLVE